MQNLFDLYSTNYINQSGRQFTIPDLTVLTGGEAEAAMASSISPQQSMEQNRNNTTTTSDNTRTPSQANVHTPPQANVRTPSTTHTQNAMPAPARTHGQTAAPMPTNTMQRSMEHTKPAPADNMQGSRNTNPMPMQRSMMGNMMPMQHMMTENIKPTPANSMAERIKSRQGCYIFAAIDLGCGHNTPIEGVLYETGDDFFSVFDSARRTLTSYHIDDVKWFTTMLSCNDVIDFREDTVIS